MLHSFQRGHLNIFIHRTSSLTRVLILTRTRWRSSLRSARCRAESAEAAAAHRRSLLLYLPTAAQEIMEGQHATASASGEHTRTQTGHTPGGGVFSSATATSTGQGPQQHEFIAMRTSVTGGCGGAGGAGGGTGRRRWVRPTPPASPSRLPHPPLRRHDHPRPEGLVAGVPCVRTQLPLLTLASAPPAPRRHPTARLCCPVPQSRGADLRGVVERRDLVDLARQMQSSGGAQH